MGNVDDADELSPAECWALVARGSVGHLALTVNALPSIYLVTYRVDDDITMCLRLRDVPQRAVADRVAALSVDGAGSADGPPWSVQVVGTVRPVRSPEIATSCGRPCASQVLRLTPELVTGERLGPCPALRR